ncbi:helix-turn-helix transcriptional regulator [Cloacibacillus evryensis]|uniref:helix-turn-helix transcriptional regulator n=1 Tax=Cloacibacillus evryensis TaxID=508460 RepID=UPI002673EE8D|nr:helix-turn-helix transcriptional regulator [Cloacibacillus evryensis]
MMNKHKTPAELLSYKGLVAGLGEILGKDCEILLHDVSNPEHSIIACANAHVSGRGVGSPMTDFGLRMLKDPEYRKLTGIYNYRARTDDGRLLKCGVCFIRDSLGEVIGFLCINMDITKISAAREALDEFFRIDPANAGVPEYREHFSKDVDDVVSGSIAAIKKEWGGDLSALPRSDKVKVVARLDGMGFFLVKGAMERLSEEMKKSKFTLYAYLRSVHSKE